MNRQFKRRIEREWNKIKLGKPCTKFVEHNNLFTIPHVVYFQAIKISEDLICVYSVGLFGFTKAGYLKHATVCQFVDSLFRSLGSIKLGFIPEEELDEGEEIDL